MDSSISEYQSNMQFFRRFLKRLLRYYELTPDEMKALEECDKESFYQRCLPFSTLFSALTYAGIRLGHLKPNPRFGAFPKVTLAVIVGYFLGKLSYQQACAEKLMALPGSYIGQLLRDKKEGRFGQPTKPTNPMFGATPDDVYSDAGPGSSLDLDTDRPLFGDDHYRAGQETGPGALGPEGGPARPVLSYEELRRRNRGEYTEARQDPYKIEPSTIPPITRARPEPRQSSSTNKYGDSME
ncbi:OCIA domain-containing protein 1 isoform X2 [Pararge aegeria]|uniref:OCIA domain-containing protein 1 isoform X2 n=1 Tax=Pararge aegeria TaxID=116150 RepID=UPI0019D076E1|nr:OCIA domain-containing protein 1 isoform X2 [Pararge aegeria]